MVYYMALRKSLLFIQCLIILFSNVVISCYIAEKAKAKNNCRVNEAEDNERASVTQDQTGGGPTDCIAVSANVNDFELILPTPGMIGFVDGKLVEYD